MSHERSRSLRSVRWDVWVTRKDPRQAGRSIRHWAVHGQLLTGTDAEFDEHFAQVPFHGARTRKSRAPISGLDSPPRASRRDLQLLRSQLVAGLGGTLTDPFTGGQQFAAERARRTPSCRSSPSDRVRHAVRNARRRDGSRGAAIPRRAGAHAPVRAGAACDPSRVMASWYSGSAVSGALTCARERASRPSPQSAPQVSVCVGEPDQGAEGEIGVLRPGRGLDLLAQRP